AIKLLMLLGCYKKEVLSLRWSQVRLDEGYILFTDSKGRSRLVALPQAALEVLRAAPRLEGNPYVCWGKKSGGHVMGVNRYFKGLVDRAGLEGRLRIQDLRHIPPASGHWLGMI
ncbi:MAG: tyrosine-type recombinase/integrase, partial [Desulfarculus sp.]|nr:tyrosine-type recombinase/integrase [Desulfarculus sp.]